MDQGNSKQHRPIYNIKAVSNLVGMLPVTLRAWERRYGLPLPQRGEQGYRMYSDYDLRILNWIKQQIQSGLSIGRAVEYLNELRAIGQDPALERNLPAHEMLASTTRLAMEFRQALQQFDDQMAADLLRRSFTLYTVDTVLMEIIQPTMTALREAWKQGEQPITVEHFATQFCMQHLNSMLSSSAQPSRTGVIIAACAPGETHEIGLLTLVVMLRWRGWDVKYLGPNLQLDRLAEALGPLHPKILLFSATLVENIQALQEFKTLLPNFPPPRPQLILVGQAFEQQRLSQEIPAIYLNLAPTASVEVIEARMQPAHSSHKTG